MLVRADGDPGDLAAGIDNEGRGVRDVECVHGEPMVDAICVGDLPGFVEEDGKRTRVLLHMFFSAE